MSSSNPQRRVLITGCSDGGLGSALAIAFHEAGLKVYATARDSSKMAFVKYHGIETLTLDVLDEQSIADCVSHVRPSLDILVNNAGLSYSMPVSDISIPEAKKIFDLNVWSYIAVTQSFLPLLLKSKGMIVNQTSVVSVAVVPFQSVYNSSKAAMAMFSDSQRLELAPFGITVIDLKTGSVKSNLMKNTIGVSTTKASLPKGSIYEPARETVEVSMQGAFGDSGMPTKQWADGIVKDLIKKSPPPQIWRGKFSRLAWFGTMLPFGMADGKIKKMTGLDVVEKTLEKLRK